MANHTPGPWTIDDTHKYYPKSCIRHNGVIVCHLPTVGFTLSEAAEEDKANAWLIAAAPELLAACEETATAIHTYQERGSRRDREDLDRCWQTMRLAIAKATQHTGD